MYQRDIQQVFPDRITNNFKIMVWVPRLSPCEVLLLKYILLLCQDTILKALRATVFIYAFWGNQLSNDIVSLYISDRLNIF